MQMRTSEVPPLHQLAGECTVGPFEFLILMSPNNVSVDDATIWCYWELYGYPDSKDIDVLLCRIYHLHLMTMTKAKAAFRTCYWNRKSNVDGEKWTEATVGIALVPCKLSLINAGEMPYSVHERCGLGVGTIWMKKIIKVTGTASFKARTNQWAWKQVAFSSTSQNKHHLPILISNLVHYHLTFHFVTPTSPQTWDQVRPSAWSTANKHGISLHIAHRLSIDFVLTSLIFTSLPQLNLFSSTIWISSTFFIWLAFTICDDAVCSETLAHTGIQATTWILRGWH